MFNILYGWIDTNNSNILFFTLINACCKVVSRLDLVWRGQAIGWATRDYQGSGDSTQKLLVMCLECN